MKERFFGLVEKELGDELIAVEEIDEGLNTVYRLESEDKEYIVKVHTNEQNEITWFKAEPRIYELISDNEDVPSPEIIFKDFSEERYEDSFYVMERLPGRNPDKIKHDLSKKELLNIVRRYGQILGKIHNITSFDNYGMLSGEGDSLQTINDAEKWTWSLKGTIDAWADIVKDKWDEPVKIDTPETEIRERLPEEPDSVLIHSDNRLDNLLVDEETITGFLDWSHPRTGHNEYDLVRAEYLLIDWDLDFKDDQLKEVLRERLYQGYKEFNSLKEDFDDRREVYRFATTAWLAAGFANWGSKLNEKEHREMREEIIKRIREESL